MSEPSRSWSLGVAVGVPTAIVASLVLGCVGCCVGVPCVSTGLRYGLWLDECPDSEMRLAARAEVFGLVRGRDVGTLSVEPIAQFLLGEEHAAVTQQRGFHRGVDLEVSLLDDKGERVPGLVEREASEGHGRLTRALSLPDVPDGDYVLRSTLDAGFDTSVVDIPLALYAPAVVHVATDRPLYKPGQEVMLRSVSLRRTDLTPLEGRPGRWRILSPSGQEMLVERDAGGPWGVADTTFPLDDAAAIGTWTAVFETGDDRDQVTFDVRPFRLPRASLELSPVAPWFGLGDTLKVKGVARYTSGAPVAHAPLVASIRVQRGRWPAPLEWEEEKIGTTGPNGEIELDWGQVPSDLLERSHLAVSVRVTEEAGEVITGGTTVVLSKDALAVEAVTELGDGLVEGFNNRVYVRVTTPDGRPVREAALQITNPFDPAAAPREARTDVDGVAALQLDPGPPVTVVDPALPFRVRPLEPAAPQLSQFVELSGGALGLAERRALDPLFSVVADCGVFAPGGRSVGLSLRVAPSGVVTEVSSGDDLAASCVASGARRLRFPAGDLRTFQLRWQVPDSLHPYLSWGSSVAHGVDPGVQDQVTRAAEAGRRCFSRGQGVDGQPVLYVHWAVDGQGRARTEVEGGAGHGLPPSVVSCLRRGIPASLSFDEAEPAMGVLTATLRVPMPANATPPQATTRTAYELKVAAVSDEEALGATRLVLPVGSIPRLRMRATPSLLRPGEQVRVELFRGPDFYGELPETLWLYKGSVEIGEAEVKDKAATFTVPADVEGFLRVEHQGARAVVFVQPAEPLSVSLSTDERVYRPGQTATLTITTKAGERGTQAAVGLSGVDASLAQLAPLLSPDDFGRVTVRVTADRPAFGAFDPRALTLGQIRGENAAKAAVLRITGLPQDAAGDVGVDGQGAAQPEVDAVLAEGFYRALAKTTAAVRAWEAAAPEGEVMEPARMAKLWAASLASLEGEGEPALDGYGRPLELNTLPDDLLEQVNPRAVVAEGTRLPEDVVSWSRFVRAGGAQ